MRLDCLDHLVRADDHLGVVISRNGSGAMLAFAGDAAKADCVH